jgi:hypothetical protein
VGNECITMMISPTTPMLKRVRMHKNDDEWKVLVSISVRVQEKCGRSLLVLIRIYGLYYIPCFSIIYNESSSYLMCVPKLPMYDHPYSVMCTNTLCVLDKL